ncbi:putative solute-binding protein [Perlucidibaca piscinae]|uniref:putative solute-binding protein n=1 Tax=Perlucidibaca piscinae TaxID=392589 RepID=UPI0003B58B05|nr:putative solute-binding protein [Perlucidibaca piscinae]
MTCHLSLPAERRRSLPGLALLASLLATLALPSQAAPVKKPDPLPSPVHLKACVFDPMGSGGKVIDVARELATMAQEFKLFVEIKPYSDERVAAEDFKAGRCELVALSTLRAKQFNFAVGSLDAPGNLRNYEEMKSLLTQLSHPVVASLAISGRYQVAAVVPIGAIFVVVNDRQINSLSKAAGKRVVVLEWDPIQAKMISGLGAQPVPADFTSYAGKFNNGQADIIAAPALGFKPMELYKGMGNKGGVIRFPLLQATGSVVLRRDLVVPRIPDLDRRLQQIRAFGLQYLDRLVVQLKEAEKDVPASRWIDLPPAERDRYYQMLREARIRLMKDGVYHPTMMSLMKRTRCQHVPGDAECGTYDE